MKAGKGDARALELAGGEGLGGELEETAPEVFGIAGVLSRPDGAPEAVVVQVGGRGHDVTVATRDHAWAVASGASGMPSGEVWVHTGKAFVRIRANGDVEIGRPDGTFEAVATKSHVHGPGTFANGGGSVTGVSGGAIVSPTSGRGIASKVKAET